MTINRNHRPGSDNRDCHSEFQTVMYRLFSGRARYSRAELAEFLGLSPDAVDSYVTGRVRPHLDIVKEILRFVAEKEPEDAELLDVFLRPAGRISVREEEARRPLNGERRLKLLRGHELDGKITGLIERAYRDNRITKGEATPILKAIRERKELWAEVEHGLKEDLS